MVILPDADGRQAAEDPPPEGRCNVSRSARGGKVISPRMEIPRSRRQYGTLRVCRAPQLLPAVAAAGILAAREPEPEP